MKRNLRKIEGGGRGREVGERWKEKVEERMEEEIIAQEGWGKEKRKGVGRREEDKVKGKRKKEKKTNSKDRIRVNRREEDEWKRGWIGQKKEKRREQEEAERKMR